MDRSEAPAGVLFYFCNVGWFFISHRLALATAAKARGYDVHVICDVESRAEIETLEQAGLKFHRVRLSRGGINPLADLRSFISFMGLVIRHRPAVVHNVTIKPVLYGSIAARLGGTRCIVSAISGLGYVFTDSGRAGLLRRIVLLAYRLALRPRRVRVIFQNMDDQEHFIRTNLVQKDQAVLIAGSGVDLQQYRAAPEPAIERVRIVLPARMLADKGVREFVDAAGLLKAAGFPVDCLLAGGLDPSNPAAIAEEELRDFETRQGVRWLGHVPDIAKLYAESHIICLPSYREGLPKALIEACAAGRPIVTTDVPGCRAVVRDGFNGFLVPARRSEELYEALARLVGDPSLRAEMGARAREVAEREFGIDGVVEKTLGLYAECSRRSAQ